MRCRRRAATVTGSTSTARRLLPDLTSPRTGRWSTVVIVCRTLSTGTEVDVAPAAELASPGRSAADGARGGPDVCPGRSAPHRLARRRDWGRGLAATWRYDALRGIAEATRQTHE